MTTSGHIVDATSTHSSPSAASSTMAPALSNAVRNSRRMSGSSSQIRTRIRNPRDGEYRESGGGGGGFLVGALLQQQHGIGEAVGDRPDVGYELAAGDHAEVDMTHVGQDRQVEPRALEQRTEWIHADALRARDVQRYRRTRHVRHDQVVNRTVSIGEVEIRVEPHGTVEQRWRHELCEVLQQIRADRVLHLLRLTRLRVDG